MSVLTISTQDFLSDVQRYMQHISEGLGIIVEPIKKARKKSALKHDDTLMTKEEFYAKIDRAEENVKAGLVYEMLPNECLTDFLNRMRAEGNV